MTSEAKIPSAEHGHKVPSHAMSLANEVLAVVVPHYGQPTETFIRRYCQDLMPERTVLIHFYEGSGAWQIEGPVLSLPKNGFGSPLLWRAFRGVQKAFGVNSLFGDPYTAALLTRFLKKHEVTAVFSQYLIAGWNVHPVVKKLGIRHVVRGHGFDLSACLDQEIWRNRFKDLEDADSIVVPTPFQESRLRAAGLANVPILSVPYGIDFPNGLESPQMGETSDPNVLRVVAAGRMVEKKAPLTVIQAFLSAASEVPELRLTYIGGGPLEEPVRRYIEVNDPDGRINLVGQQPHSEVLAVMAAGDIFMQHSITDPVTGDQEGAPVAILEAMAVGLPVVSTVHSGIPYLVEEGVSGLLTAEGDIQAMSRSLVKVAKSPNLRIEMGRKARKRAQELTWEREREALLHLLFGEVNESELGSS